MTKVPSKLELEGTPPTQQKASSNPAVSMTLHDARLSAFQLNSGKRMSTLTTLTQDCATILASAIKEYKIHE